MSSINRKKNIKLLLISFLLEFLELVGDKKGKIIEANKAVTNLLKIKPETNLAEHSLIDFFDDHSEGEKFLEEVLKTGSVQNRMVKFVIGNSDNKLFISSFGCCY